MNDLRSPDGTKDLKPKREKVTLILHEFDRGGSGRVAAYLARGFADHGMDVELVVFRQGGEVEALLLQLMGEDIPVLFLGRKWAPRAIDLLRGLPRLVRHLRQRKPDVIIATANNTAWISAAARSLSGQIIARLYLKTTNPIATSRHKGLVKSLRRWGYRQVFSGTQGVWTLSPDESQEMRSAFPENPRLFHDVINPYVTPAMLAVPSAQSGSATHRTILGVGRLTAQKRFERLIEAFALLTDPDLRLTILGEGEERSKLTALVDRLNLSERVSLPGFVTNVAEAFHNASVFVLPSDYEGLPAVVLEAMAANCPILCTDCFPAARSMLAATDGCAIIEQSDPQSLATLIKARLALPRPTNLRSIAERYSIANGIASHASAMAHP